ncbi:hypothetical protein ACFQHV_19655 [Promicromonospora thailandica]|uniref:Uncharacterized protein n=1 Tax=Promicromonospora thailandica TaxID=765201 RepID=A0A9X2JU19_9MICO|nr:hypothetical protein [Promicromonospora thailandica]MCP2262997.1 hypothetical protein [Promicromonospora thailandica]BFF18363.1 hypothetical protein GCM10025730_18840 [Promicromonospora thailandica]
MSTLPGPDSWQDAGLDPPRDAEVDTTHEPDEYVPDAPRPDADGDADEADVVEQALDVQADDPDEAAGPD